MKKTSQLSTLAIVLLILPFTSFSQLLVSPTQNVTQLMTAMLGGGLAYSNVQINCPSNAMGTFTANSTNLGISNGVMLTTGACTNAIGPNNTPAAGTCNNTIVFDPQLTSIEPNAIYDFCMLEFDVVPQCSTLQIRFVFGSEEYPEWVSAGVNDAFGFFITGPGPACQPNFYSNTNVATLPNNVTPVSIDNVNNIVNNTYYVDNTGGATIQYDGFTTVLTRTIGVCPCQTYHFKIAIADGGDCIYDSGVFIDFFQCSAPVTPTATFTPAGCNCTGTATANATGGNPPYQYSWTPSNQTTQTITGLCPGTYTVWVRDATTCSQWTQTTVTVTGSSGPTATASQQGTIACFGGNTGSATVTPSGGQSPYTYLWTPGNQTTQTATGLSAGTYTVVVTDANGCTTQTTVVVTQPSQLSNTQSQVNVLCNGQCTGTATVVASGGTPNYTYNWVPSGGNAATATGLCAGAYTCNITDANGCTSSATFNITQPSALSLSATGTQATCGQNNASATANASGGTPNYTYLWTPSNQTSQTATGIGAGTYTVTVTDANGCTQQTTVTIQNSNGPTTTTVVQTTNQCFGNCNASVLANVSGGTAPYTYLWTPGNQTTSSATGLCAGSYTVLVTDANGCTSQVTVNVTQPSALNATASSTQASCGQPNGTATANASGGTPNYTYSWAPSGGNNANATGLTSGTYTVFITDANGCTTTSTVTVSSTAGVTASIASQNNIACFGGCNGTATASTNGGTAPFTYAWTAGGQTTITATGLCAGTYSVLVTDNSGCTSTTSVTITQPSALSLNTSIIQCTNSQNNASAIVSVSGGTPGYNYVWNTVPPQNNDTASALASGSYNVVVTDNNNCTQTVQVVVPECPNDTISAPNVFSPNGDGINDNFFIFNQGYNQLEVDIFNRWGELLFTFNGVTGGWDGTHKGNRCSDGTYFWVANGQKFNGEKVILKGYVQLMTKK